MQQPQAEAFEDGIDLQIGLLEATTPNFDGRWPGYPFPNLKPTGEQEMRTFRTVLLENPYLRVVLVPALGGRILSLFDKRSGEEILRRHPLIEPQAGGRRGAFVREGIKLTLDGDERLNSLGNVATQIEHAPDEDSETAVWVAETFTGTGLSFHCRVSLPPDRAELTVEARIFNRSLFAQPYNGGLSVYLGDGVFDGTTFYSSQRDVGLGFFAPVQIFDGRAHGNGNVVFARRAELGDLAPRQVDTWSVKLVPLSGLSTCLGSSEAGGASIVDGQVRVQVTEQRLGHKLLILTHDGQTHEAPADLYPETVFAVDLSGLEPLAVVLRDPAKREVLRVDTSINRPSAPTAILTIRAEEPKHELSIPSASEEDLLRAAGAVATRHAAHTELAHRALRDKQWQTAAAEFEQALMYNADDPLLWWGKAVALRLAGEDNEQELLNAHFLAPLEPALRAESFLSQPINPDGAPSPLLAALEENPEEFIEVACLLIDCGLFDQASRWIDEALRHRDLQILHYLQAYCYLAATRLQAEASEQVRLAGLQHLAPPYPFRPAEQSAIAALAKQFPFDANLTALMLLLPAS